MKEINLFNINHLRVYAKPEDERRFMPLDLTEGMPVSNLIHATIIPIRFIETVKQSFNNLTPEDKSITFQFRNLDNKILFETTVSKTI